MSDWQIKRLNRSHHRADVSSGKPPLDDFLRTLVSPYEKRHLGRTYVAVRAQDKRVFGDYTLGSSSVACQTLPI